MTQRTWVLRGSRKQFIIPKEGDLLPVAEAAMEEPFDPNHPDGGKEFYDARMGFITITGIPASNSGNN